MVYSLVKKSIGKKSIMKIWCFLPYCKRKLHKAQEDRVAFHIDPAFLY